MSKYLITGSSGLIGQWIGKLLDDNSIEWYGIDIKLPTIENNAKRIYHLDIRNYESLYSVFNEVKPEFVIHLAARIDLDGKSLEDYDANIIGVENICKAISNTESVKRCIFTSSQLVCKVGYIPLTDFDFLPSTVYGESKVIGENIVRNLDGGNVDWCIVRPTTVWGPYMSDHYTSFIRFIENGIYFHSGKSKLYKSYAYAENIAYQYLQISKTSTTLINRQVFYLADYSPLSLFDYTNLIAKFLHVRNPVVLPIFVCRILALIGDFLNILHIRFPFNTFRLNNILTEYIFNTDKIEDICGPLPRSFQEGVEATVKWYISKNK